MEMEPLSFWLSISKRELSNNVFAVVVVVVNVV